MVIGRWPPRSRTELYRLIRAAPTTGWAVAIERKTEVSSPTGVTRREGSSLAAAPAAHLPLRRAEGTIPSANADPPSKRSPPPAGSLSMSALPADANRREMAEGRRTRSPAPFDARPPSKRCQRPGWFILHRAEGDRLERYGVTRASASNGARLLAGSPSMLPLRGDKRAARYAQTGAVVNSPPQGVPHPRFELGTSFS
jgi:hypothetical protein